MAAEGAVTLLELAESCRGPWTHDGSVDRVCEEILLDEGREEEAYRRCGLTAIRAVAKKYPDKDERTILADLVETTPGEEGKWFATAKSLGFYDEALTLARRTPCDPKTLSRAARDFAEKQPRFAVGAGLLAIHWLVAGYGYDVTGRDVRVAYDETLRAGRAAGVEAEVREKVREMVAAESFGERFVTRVLGPELGLS